MLDIFLLTVPIYLLIALGYGSVRTGYVAPEHVASVGIFVVRICLPALVFLAVTGAEGDALVPGFIAAYAAGSLAAFGMGALLWRFLFAAPVRLVAMAGLGASASNSGFMGLPIASMIFGDVAATVMAMTMIVENILIIPLAMVLADLAGSRGASLSQTFGRIGRSLAENPLVWAIAGGLLVRAAGLGLPEPLLRALGMLAAVAPGIALFVVGGVVAQYPIRGDLAGAGVVALSKLCLHPLLVWGAFSLLPPIDDTLMQTGILFAAVPMVSIFPIIAQRYAGERLAATAMIASTIVSFFTVSLLIWTMT